MTSDPFRHRLRAYLQRNEFLRHVLALVSGTALAQVVMIALTPVLTRFYTDEQMGVLAAFASVVAIIAAFATLKYDMAIMLPKQDDSAIILRRTVTWISFTLCLLSTGVLLFAAPWIAGLINQPQVAPWLVLAGASAFTLTEISILGYWLNRKTRYPEMATNRVVQSTSTVLTQIGLGFIKPLGAGGLIIGSIIGQLVAVVTLFRKTPELREAPRPTIAQRKRLLRRYRRMPLLNTPTALIDALRMNGISLIISAVAGAGALGQFNVAWRLVEVPAALIGGALAQVFFQRLATIPPGGMVAAVRSSVFRSAAFGAVPFALVFFLSPWVFPTILGAGWEDSGVYAQALVPWLFMNLITSPISTIFVVTERQHISLVFSIVFAIVPLAVILLLRDNVIQAVFAMGIAMAGMLTIYIVLAMLVARRFDQSAPQVA